MGILGWAAFSHKRILYFCQSRRADPLSMWLSHSPFIFLGFWFGGAEIFVFFHSPIWAFFRADCRSKEQGGVARFIIDIFGVGYFLWLISLLFEAAYFYYCKYGGLRALIVLCASGCSLDDTGLILNDQSNRTDVYFDELLEELRQCYAHQIVSRKSEVMLWFYAF